MIEIFYNKTHFTCIWVNLSRFKMIITSGCIENVKNTQEKLNPQVSIPVDISRFNKARYFSIYQATGILIKPATFYSNRLFCLWVCVNLIELGEQTLLE